MSVTSSSLPPLYSLMGLLPAGWKISPSGSWARLAWAGGLPGDHAFAGNYLPPAGPCGRCPCPPTVNSGLSSL